MNLSFEQQSTIILRGLQDLCRRNVKLGSKDPIPETTRNAKAVLVVGEVMCEVILFKLAVVRRQTSLVRSDPDWAGSTYFR